MLKGLNLAVFLLDPFYFYVEPKGNKYKIIVDLSTSMTECGADLVVNIHRALPTKGNVNDPYRSIASHGGRTTNIYSLALSSVIAHEFGHILGFDDAYNDVPGKGSVPIQGHEKDIMADSFNKPSWQQAKVLGEQYGN